MPTKRLTELKDLAEKGENPMAGVESKAVISDFLNGPEHVADPVRDEGLVIPFPSVKNTDDKTAAARRTPAIHWAKRLPTASAPQSG